MGVFIRTIMAAVASAAAYMGLRALHITRSFILQLERSPWLMALMYGGIMCVFTLLIVYLPMPKRGHSSRRLVEYIVSGDGHLTRDRFSPYSYPGMKLIDSSAGGNTYMGKAGEIVVTRFAHAGGGAGSRTWLEAAVLCLLLAALFTQVFVLAWTPMIRGHYNPISRLTHLRMPDWYLYRKCLIVNLNRLGDGFSRMCSVVSSSIRRLQKLDLRALLPWE